MADAEQRRELGGSLVFIGWIVWLFDLLIVFFMPAAMKLGRHAAFLAVTVALALLGLVLVIAGYNLRRKAQS